MVVDGVSRLLVRSSIARRLGRLDLVEYYERGARVLREFSGG